MALRLASPGISVREVDLTRGGVDFTLNVVGGLAAPFAKRPCNEITRVNNENELVELKKCNIDEDPVRPELDNVFRRSYGRKIYGVKFKNEIHAVMCFAYTNEIPKSVDELDKLSQDAYLQSALRGQTVGKIAIAYTVWSKKKGGGKLIVKEVFKKIKKSNHLNRLVTLSPVSYTHLRAHET